MSEICTIGLIQYVPTIAGKFYWYNQHVSQNIVSSLELSVLSWYDS